MIDENICCNWCFVKKMSCGVYFTCRLTAYNATLPILLIFKKNYQVLIASFAQVLSLSIAWTIVSSSELYGLQPPNLSTPLPTRLMCTSR